MIIKKITSFMFSVLSGVWLVSLESGAAFRSIGVLSGVWLVSDQQMGHLDALRVLSGVWLVRLPG